MGLRAGLTKQIKFFFGDNDEPKQTKYLKDIPKCHCGIKAKYHAPTKFGHWKFLCQNCSIDIRDHRFKNGFLLVEPVNTLKALEATDLNLIIAGVKRREMECPACETRHPVDEEFTGVIVCKGCSVKLNVESMFK